MARQCTVCALENVDELNAELIAAKGSKSGIARRFKVSADAVEKHAKNHLPAELVKAKNAADVVKADTLLEQVQKTQARVLGWLDSLEKAKDWKSVFQASKEFRGYLGLVGQLTGQLQSGTNVQVNVANMPSPGSAGAAPPEFTARQLGEELAALDREDPGKLAEAIAIAQSIREEWAAVDAIVAAAAPKPVQVVTTGAPVPALPAQPTQPAKPADPRATPPQSLTQPGRNWRDTWS